MKTEIVLSRIVGPQEDVLFDTATGIARPFQKPAGVKPQGNLGTMEGHTFALYAEEGKIYIQCDDNRWDITSPDLKISYHHNFDKKTTSFQMNDVKIEYPAWWANDPQFNPNLPRLDEVEDYWGYLYSVWLNPEIIDFESKRLPDGLIHPPL